MRGPWLHPCLAERNTLECVAEAPVAVIAATFPVVALLQWRINYR